MAYLIENNSFSNDSYSTRSTRLGFVSNSITTYASELSVNAMLTNWAAEAYAKFELARTKQVSEIGEKEEAFQTSQEAMDALIEKYQAMKDILLATYDSDDDIIKVYGIHKPTPLTYREKLFAVSELISGHHKRKAAADPNVLPDSMIDLLQDMYDHATECNYAANSLRRKSQSSTQELRELYEADTKRLKALYAWSVAIWKKSSLNMLDFGFVPINRSSSGDVPGIPSGISYDMPNATISWTAMAGVTSYQVAHKPTNTNDEWSEIYSGTDNELFHGDSPGSYSIKIRARNYNGYGKWSEVFDYMVLMPDFPPEV